MLSKNTIKHLKKLEKKKYREEFGVFKIEGEKTIREFLESGFPIQTVYASKKYFDLYVDKFPEISFEEAEEHEIGKASFYETNTSMIAVAELQENTTQDYGDFIVVLDDISDPGNLGTIIRICDWYGISNLVCSESTVDCYNPKVVASTKGSLARLSIVYQNLEKFFENNTTHTVYGAFLEGENLHTKTTFAQKKILIIGNEAHGISEKLEPYITERITIPCFGKAESLNAAVATGIIVDRISGYS